jgi:hypothetical protein
MKVNSVAAETDGIGKSFGATSARTRLHPDMVSKTVNSAAILRLSRTYAAAAWPSWVPTT